MGLPKIYLREVTIPGSRPGTEYHVTRNARGGWSCDCSQFQARGWCPHINTALGTEVQVSANVHRAATEVLV
jgi:hypothetical protein